MLIIDSHLRTYIEISCSTLFTQLGKNMFRRNYANSYFLKIFHASIFQYFYFLFFVDFFVVLDLFSSFLSILSFHFSFFNLYFNSFCQQNYLPIIHFFAKKYGKIQLTEFKAEIIIIKKNEFMGKIFLFFYLFIYLFF